MPIPWVFIFYSWQVHAKCKRDKKRSNGERHCLQGLHHETIGANSIISFSTIIYKFAIEGVKTDITKFKILSLFLQ